jgi:hypothetical protein
MPRMLLGRRRRWRMSPSTTSALLPTRSRPRVRLRLRARARAPAGSNAAGNATSCRRRFATLSWTISACETTSAGRYSTADRRLAGASAARQALPVDAASAYAGAGLRRSRAGVGVPPDLPHPWHRHLARLGLVHSCSDDRGDTLPTPLSGWGWGLSYPSKTRARVHHFAASPAGLLRTGSHGEAVLALTSQERRGTRRAPKGISPGQRRCNAFPSALHLAFRYSYRSASAGTILDAWSEGNSVSSSEKP